MGKCSIFLVVAIYVLVCVCLCEYFEQYSIHIFFLDHFYCIFAALHMETLIGAGDLMSLLWH